MAHLQGTLFDDRLVAAACDVRAARQIDCGVATTRVFGLGAAAMALLRPAATGAARRLRHGPGAAARRLSRLALSEATPPFVLERYFAQHEFSCKHALCSSDTEAVGLQETVGRMDDETRGLWEGLSLGYTEVKGHGLFLRELSEMYAGLGPGDFQEAAPQEAILLATAAAVSPGDAVVAMAPGYQSVKTCAEAAGGVVTDWLPRYEADGGGAATFAVEDLDALCARVRPSLVAVNVPHNPTGFHPTRDEWRDVVACVESHGARLFSDEIYRGLEASPEDALDPAAVASPRGISLGGLSKSLGMPGVRVGWLAATDEAFMRRVAELRDYTTICSSAPSQILAVAALRDQPRLLARANAFVRAGRDAVADVLEAHADVLRWGAGPRAGPIGWVRLARGSAAAYAEALVTSDDGLLLLPSTVFDGAGDGHVRVGFGRADSPALMALWRATLDDPRHPATALLRA